MSVENRVAGEPRYVQRAWQEVEPAWRTWCRAQGGRWTVRIGAAARLVDPRFVDPLVHDGYRLRIDPAEHRVEVAGADDRGTMYGIFRLARWLSAGLDGSPTDYQRCPRVALRGMYAHTAWIYAHPYALRAWEFPDWAAYVDWLAWQEYNVLQIWVPVGIMTTPPGESDWTWLNMLRQVVQYAQKERGFQVWVGEAANNLIARRPSLPFREREYFQYYLGNLRDPSDPQTLKALRQSRVTLYQTLADADGFWVIDSDPGGWPGSPTSDFVAILRMHAELMHQWAHPQAQLIYWLWLGWGTDEPKQCWEEALRGLEGMRLDRWGVLADVRHLSTIARLGMASRTMLMPYGAIEGEPRMPYPQVTPAPLGAAVGEAVRHGLAGVMGNAQTPHMQLPNLWYLGRALWGETVSWADFLRGTNLASGTPSDVDCLARLFGNVEAGRLDSLDEVAAAIPTRDPVGDGVGDRGRWWHDMAMLVTILQAERAIATWAAEDGDVEEGIRRVRQWVDGNSRWHNRIGWAMPKVDVAPLPGSHILFHRGGTYQPGRGTYGPYINPARTALKGLADGARDALRERVLAEVHAEAPQDADRQIGMIADLFDRGETS